ncbi:hypothetical protein BDW02DRAFT_567281 [Decorospora gaudefroyi]|uniref:Uncharacterized protein n=1 Tax=Decorospora gaudefroyi TaxID=184978 RepID=A0A6A5KKR0_9PLEO|nr:hypothetical protein BDW02DRAFT_567281 [Decorospora gaudefroyi]
MAVGGYTSYPTQLISPPSSPGRTACRICPAVNAGTVTDEAKSIILLPLGNLVNPVMSLVVALHS